MPNWFFDPLTNAPSRLANRVADNIDNPQGERNSRIRSFLAGAIQGAGRMGDDITSPFGIATTAIPETMAIRNAGRAIRGGINAERAIASSAPAVESLASSIAPSSKVLSRQMRPLYDDAGRLIGNESSTEQIARNLIEQLNTGRKVSDPNESRIMAEKARTLYQQANPNKIVIPSIGLQDMDVAEMMAKVARAKTANQIIQQGNQVGNNSERVIAAMNRQKLINDARAAAIRRRPRTGPLPEGY